jgi:hypothetical protein
VVRSRSVGDVTTRKWLSRFRAELGGGPACWGGIPLPPGSSVDTQTPSVLITSLHPPSSSASSSSERSLSTVRAFLEGQRLPDALSSSRRCLELLYQGAS